MKTLCKSRKGHLTTVTEQHAERTRQQLYNEEARLQTEESAELLEDLQKQTSVLDELAQHAALQIVSDHRQLLKRYQSFRERLLRLQRTLEK